MRDSKRAGTRVDRRRRQSDAIRVGLLGDAGYHVTGVSSYEEALEELAHLPDLLITDVRLGVYNGLQLIVRGRMLNRDLRAIVVTGYADQVVFREAVHLHAEHLEKPVDVDRLQLLVAKALEAPARRRAG
jgi:CheY-like chemotaxis protein